MTIKETIEKRRSIRKYTDAPLPDEDLQEILRLTSLAPSAWNLQPWRIAVVKNPQLKEQLQAASYNQSQVGDAAVVFVVYSDMEDTMQSAEETAHPHLGEAGQHKIRQTVSSVFGPQSIEARGQWALAQSNIAFGFLMLAVQSLGYSSCPMLGFSPDKVRELLDLPEHVQFAGLLPVGKADEQGHPHHRHTIQRISKVY